MNRVFVLLCAILSYSSLAHAREDDAIRKLLAALAPHVGGMSQNMRYEIKDLTGGTQMATIAYTTLGDVSKLTIQAPESIFELRYRASHNGAAKQYVRMTNVVVTFVCTFGKGHEVIALEDFPNLPHKLQKEMRRSRSDLLDAYQDYLKDLTKLLLETMPM